MLVPEEVTKLVVHCSATRPDMDVGRAEIESWHLYRGFAAIGYHFVIRQDGTVEPGRPLDHEGAHARGYNDESVGICLVGGLDNYGQPSDDYSPEQWESLERTLRFLKCVFPSAEVLGHRDLPGVAKACPCFDAREWWEETALC